MYGNVSPELASCNPWRRRRRRRLCVVRLPSDSLRRHRFKADKI
jgi:hypothetical protein